MYDPALPPDQRIICASRDYPDGWIIGPHCHAQAQLIYATVGAMEIEAAGCLWLVPPQRALWVGARTEHACRARGAVSLRTVYIAARSVPPGLPPQPTSLAVTPLLRELILRLTQVGPGAERSDRQARLLDVLIDEIATLPRCPIRLAMPVDRRLRRACEAILADPADGQSVASLAGLAGLSERTLRRLAERELGVSLSVWRQQARILAALPVLAGGGSVIEAASASGYGSPSALAATFRRLTGHSPAAYRTSCPRA